MNLAEKPCYPEIHGTQNYTNGSGFEVEYQSGLTFRERLVIALASNSQIIENAWDDDGMPTMNTDQDALERNAKSIIKQADAIIKELEK